MRNFCLIGAAGFVAPRHMKAIKDCGGNLIAAIDPHDSVGVLDKYFPECKFFTEFERFDRHCSKLMRSNTPIDYVSICSPNYLHDAHIRFSLRLGAHAICEKPLVLKEKNLDQIKFLEEETNRKVYTILQLRLNPDLKYLKENLVHDKFYPCKINYVTPRGSWFDHSWKGNIEKSGGIATNIGIHLFDVSTWLFGSPLYSLENGVRIFNAGSRFVEGTMSLDKGKIDFYLSTLGKPERTLDLGDGHKLEFSNGFTDLHTKSYLEILSGNGFGLEEARESIRICEYIRKIS